MPCCFDATMAPELGYRAPVIFEFHDGVFVGFEPARVLPEVLNVAEGHRVQGKIAPIVDRPGIDRLQERQFAVQLDQAPRTFQSRRPEYPGRADHPITVQLAAGRPDGSPAPDRFGYSADIGVPFATPVLEAQRRFAGYHEVR